MELAFTVRRRGGFYVTHVVAMIALLISMGWGIYFCAPDKLDARLGISVTLFLALLALNFVINGQIPKISYGTFLSQYFIVGYATTAIGIFESMASYYVFLFHPLCGPTYTGLCMASLYLDWTVLSVSVIAEVIYTIQFLVRGLQRRPGELVPKGDHFDLHKQHTKRSGRASETSNHESLEEVKGEM